MKVYLFIASLICASSSLSALWRTPVRRIAYADFIDEKSAFSQEFTQKLKNKSGAGAMQLLMNGKDYCFIDGVPQKNGSGSVRLCLGKALFGGVRVKFFDNDGFRAMVGTLYWWSCKKACLNRLDATPCLTGTVACQIWDSFCRICSVSSCEIEDASGFDGFFLRILLPYVDGMSFYARFGYFPKTFASFTEYTQACAFLADRSCNELIADCAQHAHLVVMLRESLDFCNLSSDVSLGTLVKSLYRAWRGDIPLARSFLKKIYEHFLDGYPVCARSPEIIALQKRVYLWRSIAKNYAVTTPLKNRLVQASVVAAASIALIAWHNCWYSLC